MNEILRKNLGQTQSQSQTKKDTIEVWRENANFKSKPDNKISKLN